MEKTSTPLNIKVPLNVYNRGTPADTYFQINNQTL